MGVVFAVDNVRTLDEDVWIGEMAPRALDALRSTGAGRGPRSVVLLTGPYAVVQGRLEFEPEHARVLNHGAGALTVFVANPEGGVRVDRGASRASVYWITVPNDDPAMLSRAMKRRRWPVPAAFSERARRLREGDHLVFYNRSLGFTRVRIDGAPEPAAEGAIDLPLSGPVETDPDATFGAVRDALRDRKGRPYSSGQAAGRAIGGRGGVLRPLTDVEVRGLFEALDWGPLPTEDATNAGRS